MVKEFAPRISKNNRETINLAQKLGYDFKYADERLLKGANLDEINLSDVVVKDQVRTKFNDDSIKELAQNIQVNGLIQPLVVHKNLGKYVLICGERRYRAMVLIGKKTAPCFVLSGKTQEELMAIQFSENSSREALHYIDRANGILNYHHATGASERKIQDALGISKSEVHRSLLIGKLPEEIKDAAKVFDIEKYVLVEFDELKENQIKEEIKAGIISGNITKRLHLSKTIKALTTNQHLSPINVKASADNKHVPKGNIKPKKNTGKNALQECSF